MRMPSAKVMSSVQVWPKLGHLWVGDHLEGTTDAHDDIHRTESRPGGDDRRSAGRRSLSPYLAGPSAAGPPRQSCRRSCSARSGS